MTDAISPAGFCIVCLLLALCACCLWAITPGGQATLAELIASLETVQEHPFEKRDAGMIGEIRSCTDNGGTLDWMYNPETLRSGSICKLSNGGFAIEIVKFINGKLQKRITALPKEKARSIQQVWKYMRNQGYGRINTPEFNAWLQAHTEHLPFLPPKP